MKRARALPLDTGALAPDTSELCESEWARTMDGGPFRCCEWLEPVAGNAPIPRSEPRSAAEPLNPGCPVVALLQADHRGRRAAGPGEIEEIGIGGYNRETFAAREVPDLLIGSRASQAGIEPMCGTWKQLPKSANKLRRQIRVKQELQRALRSRPVCEA